MSETESLPATIQSSPAIDERSGIKCPHCGQAFSNAGINIAIFLYGIFFLVDKESGYFGITCPRCLKTISHRNKKEAILALKQVLTGMLDFGDSVFDPKLRYYSSLSGSPTDIPLIGSFDILYLNLELAGNEPVNIEEKIMAYLKDNPVLEENYFCSYIQDENYPSGTFSNIWWISSRVNNKDEDAIEKLIQLENIKGIKIFPRYYHHCALIEDVDHFCWKYGYLNIHLENLKNLTIRRHEKLEQELILEGIDFKDVIDQNPDIANPDFIEFLQDNTQAHNSSEILNVTGDFLKILLDDPDPWDIQESIGKQCKGFWKTKHPFRSIALPLSMSQFSPHPFKETADSHWLKQAKSDILPEYTKAYVQTYLMENYASFIREYAEIINNRSFCYADLWTLKSKYLKALHVLVQEETKIQNKNLFYRQNGFWVVSYEGNESLIQDLDGMTYIHFLLQNKGKPFTYFNIEKLLNGEVDKEEFEKENKNSKEDSDENDKEEGEIDKGFLFSSLDQEMITPELLSKIQTERNKIDEQMNEAERSGDTEHFIELNSYLKQLDEHLKEYITVEESKKGGKKFIKIKRFKNSTAYKVKKDNVDRVLKYALHSLEEHNEAAYKHLRDSIKNKRGEIWYEPAIDADWYTG